MIRIAAEVRKRQANDRRYLRYLMYVGRHRDGSIYGMWTCRPPEDSDHWNVEELADDHPEVVQFRNRLPPIPPMTEEDIRRDQADQMLSEREIPQLLDLVRQHNQLWTELETALSALLYMALNVQPKSSHIAYAIYYGLGGFGARQTVVNNTMKQLMKENKDLESIRNPWKTINNELSNIRISRNAIVHGTVQVMIYGSNPRKRRALLSPLPFDVVRINQKIDERDDPGLDVHKLTMAVQKVARLSICVDAVNRIIGNFFHPGIAPLSKLLTELDESLTKLP